MALSFGDIMRGVGDVAYDFSGAGSVMSGVRGMQDGVGINDIGRIALGLGQAGLFLVPGGGGALAAGRAASKVLPRIGAAVKASNPRNYIPTLGQNIKQAGVSGLLKRGGINTAIGTGLLAGVNAMLPAAVASTDPYANVPANPGEANRRASTELRRQRQESRNQQANTPDLSGVMSGLAAVDDSAYAAATGAARGQYQSALDAAKQNFRTTLMGIGQQRAGLGQDLSTTAAQMGLDTSPQLDVGLDSLAQRAALQELTARGELAAVRGKAEAQLRNRQNAAALERQRRQQEALLTQQQLLLGLYGGNQ